MIRNDIMKISYPCVDRCMSGHASQNKIMFIVHVFLEVLQP